MKTHSKIAMVAILGGALFLTPFSVYAQGSAGSKLQEAQQNAQERVNQYIENRCERVSFNIDQRIERYNENKNRHVARYTEIKTKVGETLSKLQAEGYDVKQLRADLQTLDQMTIEFAQTYTSAIVQLEGAKTHACGDSEGQFRDAVEAARIRILEARDMATDVIQFVRTEIKNDLQNLRDQVNSKD